MARSTEPKKKVVAEVISADIAPITEVAEVVTPIQGTVKISENTWMDDYNMLIEKVKKDINGLRNLD